MGAIEHAREVPVPASWLIDPSPIIGGQIGGRTLEGSSTWITPRLG
jgi:hypothetical protein